MFLTKVRTHDKRNVVLRTTKDQFTKSQLLTDLCNCFDLSDLGNTILLKSLKDITITSIGLCGNKSSLV